MIQHEFIIGNKALRIPEQYEQIIKHFHSKLEGVLDFLDL